MDAGLNAHWLMNYRVVALVNQCRRLIRDEFNVRLSLTDQDLRTKLEHYAALSTAAELPRLIGEIAVQTGDSNQGIENSAEMNRAGNRQEPRPEPVRRMYRGQPLPDNDTATLADSRDGPADGADGDAETDSPQAPRKGSRKVVYRGRIIRG